MITQSSIALAVTLSLLPSFPAHDPAPTRPEPKAVDLAICLDTSGSMSGLINSAREKIWAIVNDLALLKPAPKLRIALLTFGNTGHNAEDGWVALQTPLTDDLDHVSEKLFALTTNGGAEFVGRVLQASLDQLQWAPDPSALKLIVVAGNESADQDKEVSFRDMCRRAIGEGVMVNSIYCGNPTDHFAPLWHEVATLADGQFAAIDQNNGNIVVSTPFDKKLTELSSALNGTYLPFGEKGGWFASNQSAQDSNAGSLSPSAAAQRALTKCTSNYDCATWDLVDASKGKEFDLATIKLEHLPAAMQKMTPEQREAHVKKMADDRARIQKQVTDLTAKRDAFAAEEMKRKALDPSKSFDFAVRQAIRDQATAKGFQLASSKE